MVFVKKPRSQSRIYPYNSPYTCWPNMGIFHLATGTAGKPQVYWLNFIVSLFNLDALLVFACTCWFLLGCAVPAISGQIAIVIGGHTRLYIYIPQTFMGLTTSRLPSESQSAPVVGQNHSLCRRWCGCFAPACAATEPARCSWWTGSAGAGCADVTWRSCFGWRYGPPKIEANQYKPYINIINHQK